MRRITSFASLAALACLAAETGSGSGSGSGAAKPDPIAKADPAPAPLSADKVDPAPAAVDPHTGPTAGLAPGADPNPPANKGDAKKASKAAKESAKDSAFVVWAQPGHESFGIGQMLKVPAEVAENLRSAGRARYASEAEIKAGGGEALDIEGV